MMLRKTLAMALVGLATMAAAPKPHPAVKAAKPPAMDGRDPASLIAVLQALGAKAAAPRQEGDSVFVTFTSPTEVFSAQFAGCDDKGHACQAMLFDRQGVAGAPALAQLNAFNQSSVLCRLYQDKGGRPHVEYSALLFPRDGRPELLMHLNAWRGCIGDFNAFLKDPAGFLAGAQ